MRSEYVIAVSGKVRQRPQGTTNPNMATGDIEIEATDLRILNHSLTPPFLIENNVNANEDLRLKYRYLHFWTP